VALGAAWRRPEESPDDRFHWKPQDTCNGLEFTQEAVCATDIAKPFFPAQLFMSKMNIERLVSGTFIIMEILN
jgi:hypothetical protein